MELGSLVGVTLGGVLAIAGGAVTQLIQGKREHRRWLAENRKDEYRELLNALTETIMLTVTCIDLEPTNEKLFLERLISWNESIRIIHTRLFIADEIKKADVYTRWTDAFREFTASKKTDILSKQYESIRESIVELATKNH